MSFICNHAEAESCNKALKLFNSRLKMIIDMPDREHIGVFSSMIKNRGVIPQEDLDVRFGFLSGDEISQIYTAYIECVPAEVESIIDKSERDPDSSPMPIGRPKPIV